LQQVTRKTVAKCVRRGTLGDLTQLHRPLDGGLHVGLVEVVASQFSRGVNARQRLSREYPLPHQFLLGTFVFFRQGPRQEGSGIPASQILSMHTLDRFKLPKKLGDQYLG